MVVSERTGFPFNSTRIQLVPSSEAEAFGWQAARVRVVIIIITNKLLKVIFINFLHVSNSKSIYK
jgi:hypothetical protein